MPNNILKMTFNEAIPVGGYVSFDLDGSPINETYVVARSGSGEVTADVTVEKTAHNLKTSLDLDFGSDLTVGYSGNTLTVYSKNLSHSFTNPASSHDVTFGFEENSEIEVSGISGSNYLINNDIIMTLNSNVNVDYYELSLTNLTNGNNTGIFRMYTKQTSNELNINLSPIIKGIFSEPEADNSYSTGSTTVNLNRITITIQKDGSENSYTTTKNFIRGGNRTNDTNQSLAITVTNTFNTWLQPANKIPTWTGYPIAGYRLNSNNTITKVLTSSLPSGILDARRSTGCYPVYVKFLNQKGGYSYWLFESGKEGEQNNHLGSFIRNNKVDDLGSEADSTLQLYSKVHKDYIGLIKDLCVSSEIYVYHAAMTKAAKPNQFIRAFLDRNSTLIDENKKAYAVNIKLDFDYRFNPSLLWSN